MIIYSKESQCVGKVRFPNKKAAKEVVKQMEQRHGERLNAYHCAHCSYYHIGHKVKKSKDDEVLT